MANWICPYCNHAQAESENQSYSEARFLRLGRKKYQGSLGLKFKAKACSNEGCGEIVLDADLYTTGEFGAYGPNTYIAKGGPFEEYKLRPAFHVKPQPDYIPQAIRSDYAECCKIRDLSPKASATLARRCIQGMIRDFCGISKARLIDEINELRKAEAEGRAPSGVTSESIEAIDAVRKISNIGAHMENDISIIVDVDPGEAQTLIELVEMLLDDWYVARQKRQARLAAVRAMVVDKAEQVAVAKQERVDGETGGARNR